MYDDGILVEATVRKPIIGLTCHLHPASPPRSAIVQLYAEAVLHAGGAVVALPVGMDEDAMYSTYSLLDGILLPGGDDLGPRHYGHEPHPKLGAVDLDRDELELSMARWALRDQVPILGICRGIQVLAVAAGGTLFQDIPSELASDLLHDVRDSGRDHLSHTVTIESNSKLRSALRTGSTLVNSFHHQSVRDVPEGFVISARADDGVVEGIECTHHPYAIGVQCHPEGMWQTTAPQFSGLFLSLVAAARNHMLSPIG